MLGKLVIALLLLALVFMTFKFMREREARLRDRIEKPRGGGARGEKPADETVTLKKDPETGVYQPSDD